MPTKEAPAGPSFGDSYATVPIVAPTPVAVTPATTELCAPHNRRLLTDDRRLAASRLPERARRPAGVASETWTGSGPITSENAERCVAAGSPVSSCAARVGAGDGRLGRGVSAY